jgi:hypothetical protein
MASEKIVYGFVEKAILVDKNLSLSAKLDTGAKSASLSAIDIHQIKKDGKTYLQFTVPSKQGEVEFIAEYLGRVNIKTRVGEHLKDQPKHKYLKRPVVLMRIKMGNIIKDIPVNLTNRKRFIYPLLLGRDAINAFSGLVDPSTAFINRTEKVVNHEVK